jgi:hypothetical protein
MAKRFNFVTLTSPLFGRAGLGRISKYFRVPKVVYTVKE